MPITKSQLVAVLPKTAANADTYVTALNAAFDKFGINTPKRIAAFLSQTGHESAQFASTVEGLNYKVSALLTTFGRHRISEADARRYGRDDAKGQKANQQAIANAIYGGEWGKKNLGNTQVGDGWKYRGRGWLQVTGRANYKACGDALGVDLLTNPELLEQPKYAALSAAWFFSKNGLLALADKGDNLNIGSIVNTGQSGKIPLGQDDRDDIYKRATRTLVA